MQATELVRNYFNAWNRRDPAGIVSLLTRNGSYFDIPTNKKLSGEALVRYLAHDFTQRKLHYDLVYNVNDPADSAVRLHGAEFLTVRGDKVTSIEDYYKFPLDTGSQVKPDVSEAANLEIKYRKSGLQKEQAEVYQKRLLMLMESERLYIDADLTLPELARRMNCSVNHVSQVINGEFKQSFHNFLNQYRIEAAKELLTRGPSSGQSIGEVARCVGFTSSSAFYVAFRRLCRQTPSEFRRLHRKN